LNHTAFFAAVKAGNIASLYLFEGTEEYVKQQALTALRQKLLPKGMESFNDTGLSNPDADELIAAVETLPFMCDKRVVVVRDFDLLLTGRKEEDDHKAQRVLTYLPRASSGSCLVFVVRGKADSRKKLYQYLRRADAIVDFSPLSEPECVTWVQRSMRASGKPMDADTAARLVFTVGRDAALLKQEMDKLICYTADRERIESRDIETICTQSLECTVFQLVDAQVAGQYDRALLLLNRMVRNGEDRRRILSMLLRQYRILYHTHCLLDEGAPRQNFAQLLGIPSFTVGLAQQQAKRYSLEKLKAAYSDLLDFEYQIKTGAMPDEGCAETALFRLEAILE